ncbi:MAG TPA: hypothetical protein VG371_16415, partial [Solirubrobacteraceae bacterium]|nr:hypothetical protein [Solirubrobacteraceae bacterium]
TGTVHPVTGEILPPQEPWTCGNAGGAIRLYAKIIRSPDGTFRLGDFATPEQLDHIRYMRDQKLVMIRKDDSVVPLGDADPDPGRTYPGAPLPDPRPGKCEGAALGKPLRNLADELIIDAFRELCAENSEQHSRGAGRVGISNRDICERANRNKGKLRTLDEYRYLSVETARRHIAGSGKHPGLLDQGEMTELEPPQRIRQDRTWKALPRVYEIPLDIMRAGPRPERKRSLLLRRGRRDRLRELEAAS